MKLSTRGRYGTRAVIEIAKHFGKEPIKRHVIADNQAIPDSYLENILITLKAAGIIRTIRGAQGGYQLIKDPNTLTLHDIVVAIEGEIAPVPCARDEALCEREQGCPTRMVWVEMYEAIEKVLKSHTIAELAEKELGKPALDYSI